MGDAFAPARSRVISTCPKVSIGGALREVLILAGREGVLTAKPVIDARDATLEWPWRNVQARPYPRTVVLRD